MIRVLFIILTTCAVSYAQHPLSDPNNNGGWILNPYVSDEFSGSSLDKSKWWILGENGDYRHKWKGRAPGQYAGHNVRVESGNLILTSQWEPTFEFANEKHAESGIWYGGTLDSRDLSKPITHASVMSEAFFRYGYMEIRAKIANAPVVSAFWTTGYHSEFDMMENYGKLPQDNPENKPLNLERRQRTNIINWDPDIATNHQNWKVEDDMNIRLAEGYHVYGFEWDRDYIKTYFDGTLLRLVSREDLESNNQWRHDYPQEIWFDNEVFYWYGLPSEVDLTIPAEFKIDYVLIWQKEVTPPDFDALGFEGPFYFQGRSINWWNSPTAKWRIKSDKPASGDFSLKFKHVGSFSGNYSTFSPYGSINLPSGTNIVKFKIWVDPSTEIDQIEFILNNPYKKIVFDLSSVTKGTWVEISENFNRSDPSNQNLSNGDRLQITIRSEQIKTSSALLYVDDIVFNDNSLDFRMIKREFQVYPNPASDVLHLVTPSPGAVALFDLKGTLVYSDYIDNPNTIVDTTVLSEGIYFVTYTYNSHKLTKKLILK
ncbi:family 16 glycosylhydrolase [Flavobacteriaceae bacterium]|nr:family 16 glycosylhydrolase [Flavobacteriaceae bacterium]